MIHSRGEIIVDVHGFHTRLSACSFYVCKGIPCNDSKFGLYGTVSTKSKTGAPIRGCRKSASSYPYANHYVQNPGLCDTGSVKAPYDLREGSSNINEKNALWSSFTGKMSNLFMDKLKLKNIKISG